MSACWCSLAGTAACQTCSQNPFAVMSKMMTPQPTALREIMVNLQTEKPMTNADRVRAMSDEELARFISRQRGLYCDYKDPSAEEYPKALDWLKAPVEVET